MIEALFSKLLSYERTNWFWFFFFFLKMHAPNRDTYGRLILGALDKWHRMKGDLIISLMVRAESIRSLRDEEKDL